jgi:hypothetical protein
VFVRRAVAEFAILDFGLQGRRKQKRKILTQRRGETPEGRREETEEEPGRNRSRNAKSAARGRKMEAEK